MWPHPEGVTGLLVHLLEHNRVKFKTKMLNNLTIQEKFEVPDHLKIVMVFIWHFLAQLAQRFTLSVRTVIVGLVFPCIPTNECFLFTKGNDLLCHVFYYTLASCFNWQCISELNCWQLEGCLVAAVLLFVDLGKFFSSPTQLPFLAPPPSRPSPLTSLLP